MSVRFGWASRGIQQKAAHTVHLYPAPLQPACKPYGGHQQAATKERGQRTAQRTRIVHKEANCKIEQQRDKGQFQQSLQVGAPLPYVAHGKEVE